MNQAAVRAEPGRGPGGGEADTDGHGLTRTGHGRCGLGLAAAAPPPRRPRRLPAKVAERLAEAGVTAADVERLTLEEVLDLPGVGPLTVERLERYLGRPFASHAAYWIERGLSARLAQRLAAAGIRSEEQLRRLRRADLLKIKGLGRRNVVLLLHFGRPATARQRPLTFLEKVPQARLWVEAGIIAGCARRLVAAGITSIAHLEKLTRDDLLAIRGISARTVAKCEKLVGRPLAESAAACWRARGLPAYLANVLQGAGVSSLEQLAAMSREEFLSLNGSGPTGLATCERLLGQPLQPDPTGDDE